MCARPLPEVDAEALGRAMSGCPVAIPKHHREPAGTGSDAVFNLIDPERLLSGEADYSAGQVSAPPDVEANPVGVVLDARIGRYRVRFLCVAAGGSPQFLTIWKPDRPKRLKPALVKKYRRERRNFVTAVAKQFGLALQIIDRMDGAPRITVLVYEHGEVELLAPAIPYPEDGVHWMNARDSAIAYLAKGWQPIPIPWRERTQDTRGGRTYASPL